MSSMALEQRIADDQSAVIAFLGDPLTHGGQAVERIDTHASAIFLVGERAFKLKRAVRYPYLDFSTAALRRAACEAEVAINRRTAPDLYQGVLAVTRGADGAIRFGASGTGEDAQALDWVVAMRRFDSEAALDRLAARGALSQAMVRDLADAISAFHRTAEIRVDDSWPVRFGAVVEENLGELEERPDLFEPARVQRLARLSAQALESLGPDLRARAAAGRVRHGHGDLHLGNVVMIADRPVLFDALEFDERLAVIDVLYDLAFMVMDLEHRGSRPLANALLNRYLERADGEDGLALLPLFVSARAAIRAKVAAAAMALAGGPGGLGAGAEEIESKRAGAIAYMERAVGALETEPPVLVAIGGLSGTGKTTLARRLAPGLGRTPGAIIARSDIARKSLAGVEETRRLPAEAYTAAATTRVYAEVARRARVALGAGQAVIADAVYARADERQAIEEVAAEVGARFIGVWLEAGAPTRAARVEARRDDASDATAQIVARQEGYPLGAIGWTRVDAGGEVDRVWNGLWTVVRARLMTP